MVAAHPIVVTMRHLLPTTLDIRLYLQLPSKIQVILVTMVEVRRKVHPANFPQPDRTLRSSWCPPATSDLRNRHLNLQQHQTPMGLPTEEYPWEGDRRVTPPKS